MTFTEPLDPACWFCNRRGLMLCTHWTYHEPVLLCRGCCRTIEQLLAMTTAEGENVGAKE